MTAQQKLSYKTSLLNFCIAIIDQRIQNSLQQINEAQLAANQQEKSSAGDKYETGRAMSHIQKNMFSKQLLAHQIELSILKEINTTTTCNTFTKSAIVCCGKQYFFVAAGLGKIVFDEKTFIILSPNAPFAALHHNKKVGDSILFMQNNLLIEDIF
jgi:hypothetical protein